MRFLLIDRNTPQIIATKQDLQENINPKSTCIAVDNIQTGKEGVVIIYCTNIKAKEKMKQCVISELGNKYCVGEGKKKSLK